MPKSIQHIGPIEAASNLDSVVDGDGAALDFDTGTGTARLTAKGGAGTNRLLKLRTLLAGVAVDAISVAADGVIALINKLVAPVVVVGIDPGGSEALRVGGSVRVVGTASIGAGVTIRGNNNYIGAAADVVASNSIANLGTIAIGDSGSGCLVFIATNNAEYAIYALRAGALTAVLANAIVGTWGIAAGAGNDFNVYWDAGAARYVIENRSGSSRIFHVYRIGAAPTQ